nr:MAG TPA: hypothetical protein [Caudoviricetes sp.]
MYCIIMCIIYVQVGRKAQITIGLKPQILQNTLNLYQ